MITLKEINIVCVGDIRYRFSGDIIKSFNIGFMNERYIRIEFKDFSVIEFNREHVICCEICREELNFSNVEVGFIPTEETERISVEEAIEYLGKIPIPRLMSNTLEDCIEQNKYVLAIKMGIEALLKQIHKGENK